MEESPSKTDGYGKRPLWQWILIYLVIGGIIYATIYYFFFANKSVYNNSAMPSQESQQNYP